MTRSVGALGRLIPKSTGGRVVLGGSVGVSGLAGYGIMSNNRQRSRNTAALSDSLTAAAEANLQNVRLVPVHGRTM